MKPMRKVFGVWSSITVCALLLSGCAGRLCGSEGRLPEWAQACANLREAASLDETTAEAMASGAAPRSATEEQAALMEAMREEIRAVTRRVVEEDAALRPSNEPAGDDRAGERPEVNILMMSGGGQLGAYGAGALYEWTNHNRPEFDVVTGVSTGALIATFAFLGPEYDQVLLEAYTTTSTEDVLEPRPYLCWLFSNSLATTEGLSELIEHYVTLDVMHKVAEEHLKGRRIYVGVVELKTGLFFPVNLGEIALGGDEAALRDYRDAVLASSSIPVVFPPVCRDGFAFVDGAARQNIFYADVCEALTPEEGDKPWDDDRPAEDGGEDGEPKAAYAVNMYALVNGRVKVARQDNIRGSLLGVGGRSIELLFDEAQRGALLRIESIAKDNGWTYRLASMEEEDCRNEAKGCTGGLINQFCPEFMTCLFETAQQRVRDGKFWREPM